MSTSIVKEDLVLYSLYRLLTLDLESRAYNRNHLSNALDISIGTLDLYLTKLKNGGFILRNKKKYPKSLSDSVEITNDGINRANEIRKSINGEFLTPENHNIQSMVSLGVVLDRIRDPLEEILFLSLYHSIRTFDLKSYLQMMKDLRADSNMVRVLSDLQEGPEHTSLPVAGAFFRACFFGDISPDDLMRADNYCDNVFNLLLVAEANQKQGRLKQALTIYEHLLSGKMKLTENQWVIAKTGLGLTLFKDGKTEQAVEIIRSVIDKTGNKIMKAYGKQVMARILSSSERMVRLWSSTILL